MRRGLPMDKLNSKGEVEHEADRQVERGIGVAIEFKQRPEELEVVDRFPVRDEIGAPRTFAFFQICHIAKSFHLVLTVDLKLPILRRSRRSRRSRSRRRSRRSRRGKR